jgi:isoleucyl-tRNA synthetase
MDLFRSAEARRSDAPRFTFYEGPPTANGRPGIHHVLARTLKDVICRFHDLDGKRVERKAGWDTHGLPVEVEVEKQLKIHGKAAIAEYGVEAFTRKCIDSVFRYVSDWEKLTERIGYWLDLDAAYVTYHESYVESVWWSLKELHRRGLLYQSHKTVWWWPRGGTALSSAEVGLGYRETADPAVTVRFRVNAADPKAAELVSQAGGKPLHFLAWTTTPWTLPSNTALAVGPEIDYALSDLGDECVLTASALRERVLGDRASTLLATLKGRDLLGIHYEPLFTFAAPEGGDSYRVIPGAFVDVSTGTGCVHIAPGFGEDDLKVAIAEGVGFLQLLDPDGRMSAATGAFAGLMFKDADKEILKDLKGRGLVFLSSQVRHDYPYCWRAPDDPLIQYARRSWFVRTTAAKERLLANNDGIDWHPEHIKDGRFGDFLRNNVDWALSRERFWGTPLPIWVNDETGSVEVIGSVAELLAAAPDAFAAFDAARAKDPTLSTHLRVHKPWIDAVSFTKRGEAGVYRRVPEVIDCWYDSGAMPFAQRHYPFENQDLFKSTFPADYICEGLDQTRGWFYSLLTLGTLLFDQAPYRSVIVNGLVNDKQGRKMSKSLGNTVDPWEVLPKHGADPLRWYLLAGSPPWQSKSFDVEGVAETERRIFGTLWPSLAFLKLYADLDGWKPRVTPVAKASLTALDRWLASRLHSLNRDYRAAMEAFDPMRATRLLGTFITDELSNWYIRRNRARFWKSKDAADKNAAYTTLHEALRTVAFLLAPIAPMSAHHLYKELSPADGLASVHLGDMPRADEACIDAELEARMAAVMSVVSLGRAARESAKLRVRQPLSRLVVSGPDARALAGLKDRALSREVMDELNVKEIAVAEQSGAYCTITVKPHLPVLGPRLGKQLGALKLALANLSGDQLARLEGEGRLTLDLGSGPMEFSAAELLVERKGREGYAVASAGGYMAAFDTTLTLELVEEGLARELINRIQNQRKALDLRVSTRIALHVSGPEAIVQAVRTWQERISTETLALELTASATPGPAAVATDVEGHALTLSIRALGEGA